MQLESSTFKENMDTETYKLHKKICLTNIDFYFKHPIGIIFTPSGRCKQISPQLKLLKIQGFKTNVLKGIIQNNKWII